MEFDLNWSPRDASAYVSWVGPGPKMTRVKDEIQNKEKNEIMRQGKGRKLNGVSNKIINLAVHDL